MTDTLTLRLNPRDSRTSGTDRSGHDTGRDHGADLTGRILAERLGYDPCIDLDLVPAEAISAFAGPGYCFELAKPKRGDTVVDLGSGAGMDAFIASLSVGSDGRVIGVERPGEDLAMAERLRDRYGFANIVFKAGSLGQTPLPSESADMVISNGAISRSREKQRILQEAARLLRKGGVLAISAFAMERESPGGASEMTSQWSIFGAPAVPQEHYRDMIEAAGLQVQAVKESGGFHALFPKPSIAGREHGARCMSLLAAKA